MASGMTYFVAGLEHRRALFEDVPSRARAAFPDLLGGDQERTGGVRQGLSVLDR